MALQIILPAAHPPCHLGRAIANWLATEQLKQKLVLRDYSNVCCSNSDK